LGGNLENEEENKWWKREKDAPRWRRRGMVKEGKKTLIFTNLTLFILLTRFAM